ncbi:MAG TPA: sugar phosphate nucleotidyltransferase [Candidatus Sumerlaeota bacterium]|nr:sugar phosphate nucleotidyltransferase [Candidatus Sumerlaeota bacterium]
MSEKTVGLVLAGGHVKGYGVLTHNRTKAALPFAGHYRVIDFALSNLSNSHITNIGIITQYLPGSLIEHIGGGDAWDLHGSGRMIKIMPPFVGVKHTTWFRGTTDAIMRNMNFVRDLDADEVMILSGEHIYHMDYAKALAFHRERNADLTIVGKRMPREKLSLSYGFIQAADGRVTMFKEKPNDYISDLVSIGIYIFKRDVLEEELAARGESGSTQNLVYDVIEPLYQTRKVFAYEFDGFWDYVRTVNDYYGISMSLLQGDPPVKPAEWEIVTNLEDRSLDSRNPVFFGKSAVAGESLISPGCRIEGRAVNSILSPGVIIEEGASVENSIIMHDCVVRQGARVKSVIADKNVVFERDCIVGGRFTRETENTELPVSSAGLTVVGKGVIIGEKVEVGGCSQVYPDMDLRSYAGTRFAPGVNIK